MSAAAAATAAVGASFATATYTVKRAHALVRISFPPTPNALIHSPLVSRCYSSFSPLQRRRALRIVAAVAEEEAVEAVPEEIEATAVTETEEVQVEAVSEEVEATAVTETEEVQVEAASEEVEAAVEDGDVEAAAAAAEMEEVQVEAVSEEAEATAVTETEEVQVEAVSEEVEAAVEDGDVEAAAAAAEMEEVQVNTKLYFGNLPYHCDSAQLAGIVQEYGTPELVEVLYDRNTGKSRGFAFVTMSNVEDANAVIENLDGSEYAGRYMRVNFADKPKPSKPLFPETEHKLFVGNLSWEATSESLHQMFQQCGNVVGARVLYDGETGRSRGYGFVCFNTQQELENALTTLDGEELEGRAMRVSVAEGKK